MRNQEGFDGGAKLRLSGTCGIEERGALGGWSRECFVKERLFGHGGALLFRLRSIAERTWVTSFNDGQLPAPAAASVCEEALLSRCASETELPRTRNAVEPCPLRPASLANPLISDANDVAGPDPESCEEAHHGCETELLSRRRRT